jgi:hypothetical protein
MNSKLKKLTARGGTIDCSHGGRFDECASAGQAAASTLVQRKPVYL